MLEWMLVNGWAVWLIVALLLGIVEVLTVNLTFFMLTIGALAASGVSALMGGNLVLEVLTFVTVALLLLLAVRPRMMRRLHRKPGADILSNTDRLPGKSCIVLETVTTQTGLVRLDGDTWTARSEGSAQYLPHEQVYVHRVEGAMVVVTNVPPQPWGSVVLA